MHTIIDNLLPASYAIDIQNLTHSDQMSWYWQEDQIYGNNDNANVFGLTHMLYKDNDPWSDYFSMFKPLVSIFEDKSGLSVKSIFRMQVNLSVKTPQFNADDANHIDIDDPKYISLIYYIGQSDGNTVINNDINITPEHNKCVYFPSNFIHRAEMPQEHKRRIVLNTILKV